MHSTHTMFFSRILKYSIIGLPEVRKEVKANIFRHSKTERKIGCLCWDKFKDPDSVLTVCCIFNRDEFAPSHSMVLMTSNCKDTIILKDDKIRKSHPLQKLRFLQFSSFLAKLGWHQL
jgi:hypothetical protein